MTEDLLLDLPPIVGAEDKYPPEPQLTPIAAFVQQQTTELAELAKVDLKAVALAQFGDWRADVAAARKTLTGVVHDVSTAAKIANLKTLRNRLINTPIADARKVSKAVKSRLAAVSKDVGAEEEAAVAAYDALDPLITPQIDAGQAKLDADRLEKERLATERAQKIADEQAEISGFLTRARDTEGMTAERVGQGIAALEGLTFGVDDWIDPVAAATLQLKTIEGMRQLQATLAASEAAAAQLEEQRQANARLAAQLAEQQAALDAQAKKLRDEQARIAGLQARIAEIHAAATGHEKATAADLYEAMVAVTALDVSEAQYQEYTALAMAAQDATLAALQGLHYAAVEREEEIEAVRQRAITPAANVATAAATDGKAEDPEPGKLEAAQADDRGLVIPLADWTSLPRKTVDQYIAGAAAPAASNEPMPQPGVAPQNHQLPEADAAPGVGTAEPRGGAKPWALSPFYDTPAPDATDPRDQFLALVMSVFTGKFASHPKPSASWWAEVRAAGQKLQGL